VYKRTVSWSVGTSGSTKLPDSDTSLFRVTDDVSTVIVLSNSTAESCDLGVNEGSRSPGSGVVSFSLSCEGVSEMYSFDCLEAGR